MTLLAFDAAVRVAAIAILLPLAWALFRQRGGLGTPALLFAPLALCLAGFLAGNTPDPAWRLTGPGATIAGFASGCTVVFLWWFCLACFDRQFRPRGTVLAIGLAWVAIAVTDRLTDWPGFTWALIAMGYGIVAHLVWRLQAEREGDLIQQRHDARATVALLLGGLLFTDLTVDLLFGFDFRPIWFALAENLLLLGFTLWLAGLLLRVDPGVLAFQGPAPASAPDGRASMLRTRLRKLIEEERVHLDPELSFAAFVERMGAPERVVRRLINHELGFDHFRAFLNHCRVEEACRRLADPARSHEKLIAIALDSGFASVPSFNRAFRTVAGCAPGEFRERARAVPGFEQRFAVF